MKENASTISVYTDGSCNTKQRLGGWLSIILWDKERQVLSGIEKDTTHNRMELQAVIEAIFYVQQHFVKQAVICIYSDSQYVTELPRRKQKIMAANYLSKKGTPVQNHLLLQTFFQLLAHENILLKKVPAHQKSTSIINHNTVADIMVRKLVREELRLPAI